MRVAVVNLTAGGLSGGYLKYLRRIVPLLASHPDIESLEVFAPERVRAQVADQGWRLATWPADDARRGFRGLKRAVRDLRPDVVFIPTANWLDFGGTPTVVMVRNMEPLEVPFGGNPLRESLRNLARRTVARRACRHATRVIAVSSHVREFLVARWRTPAAKVSIVYHGVDVPGATSTAGVPASLGGGAPGDFLFTAGSIRPARGLHDLIEALPLMQEAGLPGTLVIAGRPDAATHGYQRRLIARAQRLGVAGRIIWAGGLSEEEMRWCFRHCAVFVMTSRAEACPNVALEAMSHGCACVSVDRAPMPEFFGGGAEYYRAGDAAALAAGVRRLSSSDARQERTAAALARARSFDWNTTARMTVAELRAAVHS